MKRSRIIAAIALMNALASTGAATGASDAQPPLGAFAHDEVPVEPGMRTVCVAGGAPRSAAKACFDMYPYTNEDDPSADYRVWRWLARGEALDGGRLGELSAGLRSPEGRIVEWDPGADLEPKRPGPVPLIGPDDRSITAAGVRAREPRQQFEARPGLIRPTLEANHLYVSWTPDGGGTDEVVEVGGAVLWKLDQGASATMPVVFRLETKVE